jgi:hypothetical protein
MVHLFEDTNLCAIHAKRVTISESSQLASRSSELLAGICRTCLEAFLAGNFEQKRGKRQTEK